MHLRKDVIAGIPIPDSRLAREVTELIRDTESPLLFHHSRRVFLFGSLQGERHGLDYDPELLYVGAMFHDLGLVPGHWSEHERFEIDGANAAREFLEAHGLPEEQVMTVWESIALHTTPEIPRYKQPEVRLVTLGVQYDVIGHGFQDVPAEAREQVIAAHPRTGFKDTIVDVFYAAMRDKPDTAYGTFHTDILAARDATYVRPNFLDRLASSPFAE